MLNHLLVPERERQKCHTSHARKPHAAAAARAISANLAEREKRLPFLPSCNPGWKILIELYIAQTDNRPISITDIGHVSAIPTATILRWLALLADNGLVVRSPDTKDRRRTWLNLTPEGESAVEEVMLDMTSRLVSHVDSVIFA